MAPAPNPGPTADVAAAGLASVGLWRLLAVSAPHVAALAVMLQTETDFGSRAGFLLAWGILNFFWISLLRRPALSGALSLTLVVMLILLSPGYLRSSWCRREMELFLGEESKRRAGTTARVFVVEIDRVDEPESLVHVLRKRF